MHTPTLDHRLSFGKGSPEKVKDKYSALEKYYEHSSPIKKVHDPSDFENYHSKSLGKYDEYERENYAKSPVKGYGLSSKHYMDSPTKHQINYEISKPSIALDGGYLDRMQTRLNSAYDERKFRGWMLFYTANLFIYTLFFIKKIDSKSK